MNSFRIFLFIFIFANVCMGHSPDRGLLTVSPGTFVHQTINSDTNALFGLGVIAEMDFSVVGGIEAGFFYFLKSYKRTFGSTSIVQQVRKLAIPVGYRVWLTKRVSLGLFFNSLFSNGAHQTVYSDPSITEYTLAQDIPEYGLEGSVQLELFNHNNLSLLLDGRYFYSISVRSKEQADMYSLFVALKFIFPKMR
ncbi:MAG: hypothetical protein IPM57_07185 [Oligoflexia bacterium]|nr:hypothetical protein [Oligoflexia bacterium]